MNDRTIGRAGFLGLLGAGALGLFFARDFTGLVGRTLPKSVAALAPSGWRIYTIGPTMPNIDPATYRLQVAGLVGKPTVLTLDDLKSMPKAEQVSDFHCVTGWVVKNVRWGGVRLHEVLAHVGGPTKGAKAIRFVSAEVPYDDSLTLQQAYLPDVMLAYEMDGKPLSRPHGAPVRLVMPRMYGYKSVKWVNRLELMGFTQPGFWEQNGYDVDAWIGRSNGL